MTESAPLTFFDTNAAIGRSRAPVMPDAGRRDWKAAPSREAENKHEGDNMSGDRQSVRTACAARVLMVALVGLVLGHAAAARAAAPSPLDGFNPNADNTVRALAVAPDGKILVGGDFTTVSTTATGHVARLLADGSPDVSFNSGTGADSYVGSLAVQADGKVLMGGDFAHVNGAGRSRIARLNADGSLDAAFDPAGAGADGYVASLALQADGKVLVGGYFTSVGGTARNYVARLNADGSLDTTFDPGTGANGHVFALATQNDGKVLVGGAFTGFNGTPCDYLVRLNPDGSRDATFGSGTGANGTVVVLALQPDGKVLLGGAFTSIGGVSRNRLARLSANGLLDLGFDPGTGADSQIDAIALQPDGRALVGGAFASIHGTARNRIARLNADGSLDATFDPGTGANSTVYAVALQADGKPLLGGDFSSISETTRHYIARLNADGSLETDFDPGTGANGVVYAIAALPDGKVLAGGWFTTVNGSAQNHIARLNADGSVDTTFDPGTGPDSVVLSLAVLADGKVLAGGAFTTINGTTCNHIARLNTDGSLDTDFKCGTGADSDVYAMAVEADGKIVLCGRFGSINGTARNRVARLNSDGSLDSSFDPGTGPNNSVYCLVLQPDGKAVIAGQFTAAGVVTSNHIARLNPNGSIDSTFNPGTGLDDTVYALAEQPDGKVLVMGVYTEFNGTACNRLIRIEGDGSLDNSFESAMGTHTMGGTLALQADGRIFITGAFDTGGGPTAPNRVVRLDATGALDATFGPVTGDVSYIDAVALTGDGKVLVGGLFTTIADAGRNNIARLSNPDAAVQHLSVAADGTSITWNLGGSYPQPYEAEFDESPDGTTWAPVGRALLAPGLGCVLTTLSQPVQTNHYLRATAGTTGGQFTDCSSLLRSVLWVYGEPVVQYALTYLAGPGGSVGGSPSVVQIVDSGTSGTAVTAVPNTGYHFVQWSDGRTDNPRADTNVVANVTVTASFMVDRYSLTYAAGAGGSISGQSHQTIDYGTDGSQVTAVPARGYRFVQWSDGVMTAARTDTNVTADISVTASFVRRTPPAIWEVF